MPHHTWGDTDFDWNSLDKAMSFMGRYCRIFRIGVQYKEKYGTARWDFFIFDGSLHSITHPGYCYIQYKGVLRKIANKTLAPHFIIKIVASLQLQIIKIGFWYICKKYPHIEREIVCDADGEILPKRLAELRDSMWTKI
jgi:hypothetical protein